MQQGMNEAEPVTPSQAQGLPALAWVPTRKHAMRIAALYALLGALWVLVTGLELRAETPDPTTATWVENAKGWFFVAFTAVLLGVVLDRTFRALRESLRRAQEHELRLKYLGDNLPDSYVFHYGVGGDGGVRFRYISAGVERIHGVSVAQVLEDGSELARQDSAPSLLPHGQVGGGHAHGDVFNQVEIRRPDGERRILEVRGHPGPGSGGETEWYGVVSDVTKLSMESEAARDRLRLFIAHAPGAVAMLDRDMRYLAVSQRWMTDHRLGERNIIGQCHYEVFRDLPEDRKNIHQRALAGETFRGREDRFVLPDGSTEWITWEVHPWRTAEDAIGGVVIFSENVSERRRTLAALRDSEAEFRAMFEVASVGMGQADPFTGRFLRVNRKLCEITGYSEAEILQMRFWDLTHPEDQILDRDLMPKVISGELPSYRREKRYLRKDGRITWVSVNMTVVRDGGGQPLRTIATIEEITGRKQAEEERLRLATAMEQAAEAICITDPDARILYVNPAFERTTGYTRDEVLGNTPRLLKSDKQGAAFYAQMWEVLRRGDVWHGHFINKRKDGTLFEEDAAISPVRDNAGAITNYVAIKLDVTREMALQARLRQAQKLEAIGQLAGGVAHDFNNVLAVILMQADQALEEAADSPLRASLLDIKHAAERAASLTRQLLLFSRRQVMQEVALDLNEVVTNLAKMLRRILGEDIQLRIDLHGKPLWIRADAGMIDQVLMNLSVNARDAMPSGGRLTVATDACPVDVIPPQGHARAPEVRYCRLIISDSGCGIAPDVLPKIFEPFFTTKAPGKGTGLGLATVYGIVEQHKGWLEVASEVGRGSTFQVFLPLMAGEAGKSAEGTAPARMAGAGQTILLVEDDVEVRRSTRTVLERHGYVVLEAGHGREALAVVDRVSRRIDLLLTDMVLPEGMNGRDVANAVRGLIPRLKVVFMSGYSPDLAGRSLGLEPGEAFVQKPFAFDVLLATLGRSLPGKQA